MRRKSFQDLVGAWMGRCFGGAHEAKKLSIRNFRFLEEALELVQSAGMTREEAYRQVDYTFDRPPGKSAQELGGVMVTLAAWAETAGLDMQLAGWAELGRVDTLEMIMKIRAKQKSKPGEGPPRPLWDTNNPRDGYVSDAEWADRNAPAGAGEVVVTKDATGAIVLVSRQDDEGRILSVIAEPGLSEAQRAAFVGLGDEPGLPKGNFAGGEDCRSKTGSV